MKKTAITILILCALSVCAFAISASATDTYPCPWSWGACVPYGFELQSGTIQTGTPPSFPRYYLRWADRLIIKGTDTKFTQYNVGDILGVYGSLHFADAAVNWAEMKIVFIKSDTEMTVDHNPLWPFSHRWFRIKRAVSEVTLKSAQSPSTIRAAQKASRKIYKGVSVSEVDKAIGNNGVRTGGMESPKGKTDFYRWTLTGDVVLKSTFRDGALVSWVWEGT